MLNTTPQLKFTTREYPLPGNKSIIVWRAVDQQKIQPFLTVRFIADNDRKNNAKIIALLEDYVKKNTKLIKTRYASRVELMPKKSGNLPYQKYAENDFKDFLIRKKLNTASFIYGKKVYKANYDVVKKHNSQNTNFYPIEETEIGSDKNHIMRFGYEMPKDINDLNTQPLFCVEICAQKKRTAIVKGENYTKNYPNTPDKRVYFSLVDEAPYRAIHAISGIDYVSLDHSTIATLKIPYVIYEPNKQNKAYDRDIQTRVKIQSIIAKNLAHLKTKKSFRADGNEKYQVFLKISQEVSKASWPEIQAILDSPRNKAILSEHRDLFGSFFFFKPHSINVLNELKKIISTHMSEDLSHSSSSELQRSYSNS